MPLQLRLESRYLGVGLAPSALGGVAAALRGAPGVVAVAIRLAMPPLCARRGCRLPDSARVRERAFCELRLLRG